MEELRWKKKIIEGVVRDKSVKIVKIEELTKVIAFCKEKLKGGKMPELERKIAALLVRGSIEKRAAACERSGCKRACGGKKRREDKAAGLEKLMRRKEEYMKEGGDPEYARAGVRTGGGLRTRLNLNRN